MGRFSDVVNEQTDEVVDDVNFSDLPEQFSGVPREPLPQPGRGYEFLLPQLSKDDDIWDERATAAGKRLTVQLALVVTHSPWGENLGQVIRWRMNNQARMLNGKNTSTWAHLIKDGLGGADLTGAKLSRYADELISHSGERFAADLGWTGRCNPDRDARGRGDQGEVVELGRKGCGQRYGLRAYTSKRSGERTVLIPRNPDNGLFLEYFTCLRPNCGALVNVFPDLSNFRPAQPEDDPAEEPQQ